MSTLRLQVDAGDPFQFLIVVKALTTISGLQKQIEEDFSELYGKHFQASLQVLRIQDPHHNDIPFSLKASSILKDMDKVYVVIKNLQLPPTPSTQDDTTPRPLTTPKFILPSADPYVGSTFTNLGHHLSLPGLRNNTQMEIDSKKSSIKYLFCKSFLMM
eukprot:TRINITY_DN4971_c0_g2_i2.p1 TRINITY_DN4971_c0_g2~~TRINITY_DN4971_c0_g2_i2.p1  ORF type:complete len:159 (-),score=24.51 TRINITY_DN4971_c0_g2_i2:184-660(-)